MLSAYALGATLYMPATRSDLWAVVSGEKIPQLRSVVICLEDAVSEQDVGLGLQHLQHLLQQLAYEQRRAQAPLVFVRPRHARMAAQLADWPLIHQLDGFVLPKFDLDSLTDWQAAIPQNLLLLPTLETAMVYDSGAMRELREHLSSSKLPVLALRIGGNDLLACLGLRRPPSHTLYQTPLAQVINQLIATFMPHGFALTAPVCEYFEPADLLKTEVELDVQHGLVGKTIIHPSQIGWVHRALQVDIKDYTAAQAILAPDARAVFQYEGAMLEPATHRAWAARIVERARYYGVLG
ncbi:MAG: HpcH/HpaI aldolase/citrate lyase family protein, partial [Pseudomonadota bacterium]|nr:HpcH/HpaI aldolase/citrate lyase family protein [Pseudomonadota bacterium]